MTVPRIRGTQIGLRDFQLVDLLKKDMLAGRYAYLEARGQIGGVVDRSGTYHVIDGHHRMAAALEIFRETGENQPVLELLRNGLWGQVKTAPADSRPMPSRTWWGAFRNWLGFLGLWIVAAFYMKSDGFSIGHSRFPPFVLRAGEAITCHVPSQYWDQQDLIVRALTGQDPVRGLTVQGHVQHAAPAHSVSGMLRWFKKNTVADWLKKSSPLSESQIQQVLGAIDLRPDISISSIAGTPRTLLGLEAAWARGAEVVVFTTAGLDRLGRDKVLHRVAEELPKCAGFFLSWPCFCQGKEGRDSFPGSQEIRVERSDIGQVAARM